MEKNGQNELTVQFLSDYDRAWRDGLFKTQTEFCEKTGADKATLSLVLSKNRNAPMSLIHRLDNLYKSANKFKNNTIDKKGVPVYNVDFTAGDLTQFTDEPQRIVGYIDLNGFRRCIGFVQIKGSSMYPDFIAGDIVGVEPIKDFKIIEYGQPFGVVTKTDQRLIKIIRKGKDDDHLILRSANKEYDDISIHRNDIDKLFKVHGPVRDQWQ